MNSRESLIKPFLLGRVLLVLSAVIQAVLIVDVKANESHLVTETAACGLKNIIKRQTVFYKKFYNKSFYTIEELATVKALNISSTEIRAKNFHIVDKIPHDEDNFIQGLAFSHNNIYEVSGSLSQSKLIRVDLLNQHTKKFELDKFVFAEGVSIKEKQLVLVSLMKGEASLYDIKTLNKQSSFNYEHQGWGVTHVEKSIVISDGSARLYWYDEERHTLAKKTTVKYQGFPLKGINEMENINGVIYANIWPTNCIAIISAENSTIISWLDITHLFNKNSHRKITQVANGIAYDSIKDQIYITGKNWKNIFVIQINK